MNPAALIYPIWMLAGVIFGAGGAWAIFLRVRKDLNALGKIQRRDRWNLMLALLVIIEKRDDRQRIVDLMRDQ